MIALLYCWACTAATPESIPNSDRTAVAHALDAAPTPTLPCCVGTWPDCRYWTVGPCNPTVTPLIGTPTVTPPILPVPTNPPAVSCGPQFEVAGARCPVQLPVTTCPEPAGIQFVTTGSCPVN